MMAESLRDAIALAPCIRRETPWPCGGWSSHRQHPECAEAAALKWFADKVEPHLDRLRTLGNEPWKTPGHPMNGWVSKEAVHLAVGRIDAALADALTKENP